MMIVLLTFLTLANSEIAVFDSLDLSKAKAADKSWIVVLKEGLESSVLEKTWSILQEDGHEIVQKLDFPRLNIRSFSMIPKLSILKNHVENNNTNESVKRSEGQRLWQAIYHSSSNPVFLEQNIGWVEPNMEFKMSAIQSNPQWNLDRIDQAPNPLDRRFGYLYAGSNVNVYVMDSGIRTTHQEFEGRAHFLYNYYDNGMDTQDCNGHGTHVSGIVGAKTYGVAKNVSLYNVKVLDCAGVGSSTSLLYGMNAVAIAYISPAILSLSLGGPSSPVIDNAATTLIRTYGVSIIVAAGNDNTDACYVSPARVGGVVTVGATSEGDSRSSYSNYGSCVKLFAPGDNIRSLSASSDTATVVYSGTSMAAPHASGAAAILLTANSSLTPADIFRILTTNATLNLLTNIGSYSPNRLLFQLYNEGYDSSNVAAQGSLSTFLVDNWIIPFLVIVGIIVIAVLYNFYRNRRNAKKAYDTAFSYQLPFSTDYVTEKENGTEFEVAPPDETLHSVQNNSTKGWTPTETQPQAGGGYLRIES